MRRETILMIWIGGFVLAVLLYLIGPDRFIDACLSLADAIDSALRNLVAQLGARTYGAVRAAAIAIFVVFAILCLLASQRGLGGFWPLVVVAVLFMVLTWHPFGIYPAPLSRWITALVLVVVSALLMTKRLMESYPKRNGPVPPFPPGRGP